MSDMMEIDTGDDMATRIVAVGEAVSRAAEELKLAAEQLLAEEERVKQAEVTARTADEKTRGQVAEVEGRFRRADERAHEAEEKARLLDVQSQELKARLAEIKKSHVGGMPVVADKERSTLKDAVAGEVRRPLTSILGIALAMKHTDPKAADGQEMIRQLSSNARKLDRLVSVLLELERLMDGSLKPNRRRTDLQALVRRVVEESPDLSNREVKIEAEHVIVAVDPSMTEQMVDSLLANAGRRATPGTPVWIKVTTDPEGAVIAVDDTSPDVPDGIRRPTLAVRAGRPPGLGVSARCRSLVRRARGPPGLPLALRRRDRRLSARGLARGGRRAGRQAPGGFRMWRATTPRWIWFVPSEICVIFASRI